MTRIQKLTTAEYSPTGVIITATSAKDPLIPKVIAKITCCGAFRINVYDYMDWNPPTPEQIKNLKEMLNIDVELIGEDDDL